MATKQEYLNAFLKAYIQLKNIYIANPEFRKDETEEDNALYKQAEKMYSMLLLKKDRDILEEIWVEMEVDPENTSDRNYFFKEIVFKFLESKKIIIGKTVKKVFLVLYGSSQDDIEFSINAMATNKIVLELNENWLNDIENLKEQLHWQLSNDWKRRELSKPLVVKPEPITPKKENTRLGNPLQNSSEEGGNMSHKVKEGEKLSEIASNYGLTVQDLLEWNGISSESDIVYGTTTLLTKDPRTIDENEMEREILKEALRMKIINLPDPTKPIGEGNYPILDIEDENVIENLEKNWKLSDYIPKGNLGGSLVSWKDVKQRAKYIQKAISTAKDYLDKYQDIAHVSLQKELTDIAKKAVKERNDGRISARKDLSWGAQKLSEAIEGDRNWNALVEKYGIKNPQFSRQELEMHIIKQSGKTNPTLKVLNKGGQLLGPGAIALGIIDSVFTIADNPSFESIIGEVISWIGGAIGFSFGVGIAAVALAALELPLLTIIAAFILGAGISYLLTHIGKAIGKWIGKIIDEAIKAQDEYYRNLTKEEQEELRKLYQQQKISEQFGTKL